jgi:hypothetical protein
VTAEQIFDRANEEGWSYARVVAALERLSGDEQERGFAQLKAVLIEHFDRYAAEWREAKRSGL